MVDVLLAIMAQEENPELVLVLDELRDVSCRDIATELRRRRSGRQRSRTGARIRCRARSPHRA
ncbi:MAG: hypothetical protein AB7P03_11725 [Kofleriaceae bacterium]